MIEAKQTFVLLREIQEQEKMNESKQQQMFSIGSPEKKQEKSASKKPVKAPKEKPVKLSPE